MTDYVGKQDPLSGAQNIKEGTMQERTLLRIGAVWLIAGLVLFAVAVFVNIGLQHGGSFDSGDTKANLQAIAGSPLWSSSHVVGLAALLLSVGGLLALSRSITKEPGAALARLGFTTALLGGAFLSVGFVLEGSHTMKALAEASAATADKEVAFAVVEAMFLVSIDINSWGSVVFFGVAPILFGLAIALTDLYPKWLGWVAVVGGVGAVSMGIVLFLQGLTLAGTIGFTAFGGVVTVSLLVMGVLMWRRAGAAAKSVEGSSSTSMTTGTLDRVSA